MHLAAAEGHKDVVELLLANRADVEAKTIMGMTPLDIAILFGNCKDILELLRQHGGHE
jgi:ankyrin repeat protein